MQLDRLPRKLPHTGYYIPLCLLGKCYLELGRALGSWGTHPTNMRLSAAPFSKNPLGTAGQLLPRFRNLNGAASPGSCEK